jgi:hypothetical protein
MDKCEYNGIRHGDFYLAILSKRKEIPEDCSATTT